MGKMKVKVYFYHLFILTVVMLLCFFLMYRDMKRIETNMLNIYQRCNNLDKMLTSSTVPNVTVPSSTSVSNNMLNNIEKLDQDLQNENNNIIVEDNNDDSDDYDNENDDEYDNDGENNENNNDEVENIEIEDNENSNSENNGEENSENQENEVKDLLQKVLMVNYETNETDDVEDLLNSIDNEDKDLGNLREQELLSKTNNELKEYLKKKGKSTRGNKEQLVKNILEE